MYKENKFSLSNILLESLDLLRTILVCIFIVFLLTSFLFKPVKVDGLSMYPTLDDGEYGFSFVLGALLGDFNRFDVVIVQSDDDKLLVKRIIALPGETIEYKDDILYIDGEIVEETFLDEEYVASQLVEENSEYFTNDFGPYTLGEDEYFVLGDNRLRSYDSRHLGAFDESQLISKSLLILYPFSDISFVTNE